MQFHAKGLLNVHIPLHVTTSSVVLHQYSHTILEKNIHI